MLFSRTTTSQLVSTPQWNMFCSTSGRNPDGHRADAQLVSVHVTLISCTDLELFLSSRARPQKWIRSQQRRKTVQAFSLVCVNSDTPLLSVCLPPPSSIPPSCCLHCTNRERKGKKKNPRTVSVRRSRTRSLQTCAGLNPGLARPLVPLDSSRQRDEAAVGETAHPRG